MDGNNDIKFSCVSPNIESETAEGRVNDNVPVTNKATPQEKKQKVESNQEPLGSKSKQTWEEIQHMIMIKKSVNNVAQVTKFLHKPEEDDSERSVMDQSNAYLQKKKKKQTSMHEAFLT